MQRKNLMTHIPLSLLHIVIVFIVKFDISNLFFKMLRSNRLKAQIFLYF